MVKNMLSQPALLNWFENVRKQRMPISFSILCEKAWQFVSLFRGVKFAPTYGWLTWWNETQQHCLQKNCAAGNTMQIMRLLKTGRKKPVKLIKDYQSELIF